MKPVLSSKQILHNTELLSQASKSGDVNEVKRLIPISDPKLWDSVAMAWAALKGHLDIIQLLLPVSDPRAQDCQALLIAAENGHLDIVKLLLPVSDPTIQNNEPLRQAALHQHTDVIKLLLPLSSDYNFIFTNTSLSDAERQNFQQCVNEYEVMQQQERLQASIEPLLQNNHSSAKRKM